MPTRPIVFHHRGAIASVRDAAPTRSVLDWLREDARCTGTKEGCNEGDCGACTVVVGELDGDALALRTVNACMQFVPTLDGKALYTVEDLKAIAGGALHPVQRALVECHGSQCGFCTPGFAMSMAALYERHLEAGTRPTRQQIADELSGNLCRCTGYRPILDAAERMFELPAAKLDRAPVIAALRAMRADAGEESFVYQPAGAPAFHAPRTVEALAALCEAKPEARLLAGCTDIGVWVNKLFRPLGEIVYLGEVEELKRIDEREGESGRELRIGAGASLEAAWGALAARFEGLADIWLRFASPPIRSAGTMGGNVANGSPIGDSAPVLMALDAEVELRRGDRVRRLPLAGYYTGYLASRIEPGEFVQALCVPLSAAPKRLRAYKISKRYDSDISALCAAISLRLDGDVARDVRIAYSGMAATVARACGAEAAIEGRSWSEATLVDAQRALAADYAPLTDLRASAGYRTKVAQNLLRRCWLETRSHDPLAGDEVSVWDAMHPSAVQGA